MVDLAAQGNIKNLTDQYSIPDRIHVDIFRRYDIRGPVYQGQLDENTAYSIGLAIGSEAQDQGAKHMLVARDGRVSSPTLTQALITGLLATGIDLTDIGLIPTPLLYFATCYLPISSGVMVTASHNPKGDNGFKTIINQKTLANADIQKIYQRIVNKNFIFTAEARSSQAPWDDGGIAASSGRLDRYETIIDDYCAYVTQRISLARPLKVVVDCGNGVGGLVGPKLYRRLGCEVIDLYSEVDGTFPNHHPDPTVPALLQDLITAVKKEQADIGIAYDGDADRIGVVTNQGEVIWPDRQLMPFAQEVLHRSPGQKIVFDVKCSSRLIDVIQQAGGVPVMWCTGHSLIKSKMLEVSAPLAGEMSGHIFFKDEWFGFDDGIYAGARLLRILSQTNLSSSQFFATFPNSINTPELKIFMEENQKADFLQRLANEADFGHAKIIAIDGLRIEFSYGWGLVRASNTSPNLTLRFEADTLENLQRIQTIFRQQLLTLDTTLQLPF